MNGRMRSIKDRQELRNGITTGASAAAAAYAAALFIFTGRRENMVTIDNPFGQKIAVPVQEISSCAGGARATVIKDGGDDPDVTHGLPIIVEVVPGGEEIVLAAGPGVGTVTRPGLPLPVGEPAINPVPRQMIQQALEKVLPPGMGARVTVSVPGGREVARRTLNPRLGIEGGISILGTSGIVRPMSEEAYKASLVPQIQVARAAGYDSLVLVPGHLGWQMATSRLGLPAAAVVETSNFIGFMLEECVRAGVRAVLLCGHLGKMIKLAGGIFHTHSRIADARREILVAHAALVGAELSLLEKIMQSNTVEEAAWLLRDAGWNRVFMRLAGAASRAAQAHVRGELVAGTVLLDRQGEIWAMDAAARAIGEELGWSI